MLKLNTPKGKRLSSAFEKLAGNTRLIPPNSSQSTSDKTSLTPDKTKLQPFSSLNKPSETFHNHLDWSTWNFTELNEKQFRELIQRTGQGLVAYEINKPWSCGSKAKKYENTLTSPIGLRGGYTSSVGKDSTDNVYDVSITMSGEYFSPLSAIEQWELCRYLSTNYSPECLRIDISVDDYSSINIPLDEMLEAYDRGDYFDFRELCSYTSSKDSNNFSTTHYFGAKGSKRRVKVYFHNDECLRLETQFRGEYAQIAFEAIASYFRIRARNRIGTRRDYSKNSRWYSCWCYRL
jgi:DNA relaxase NicK